MSYRRDNNKVSTLRYILSLSLFCFAIYSCNVTRKLPSDSYLLTKNSIDIHYGDSVRKDNRVTESSLTRFIPLSQTANKRVLGTNMFLWIYNLSDTTKNNGFNRFLRRIGEPPVLLDSTYLPAITKEMSLYMSANGYFNAEVTDSVRYRKKRAFVSYDVDAGDPYIIDSISYKFNDKSLESVIISDTINSLVRSGEMLSRLTMDAERARITKMLLNYGYYQFSTANVRYVVDTIGLKNHANVEILIDKSKLSGVQQNNKVFRIRNIYVNTNYKPVIGQDTIAFDTVSMGAINFIYQRDLVKNIKPDIISRAITLYPNLLYSSEEINYTSANLSNLKFFKSVNILFTVVEPKKQEYIHFVDDKGRVHETPEGFMDCTILCSPTKRQSYKADFEVSSNTNYTGLSVTVGYGNKNIFKRAEQFDINVTTSYDFMRVKSNRDSYEFGIGASLMFPRLAAPKFFNRFRNLLNTSTGVDFSFSSQRRPDYDRKLFNASFGYKWGSNKYLSYSFKPINMSIINVPWISTDFIKELDDTGNAYLRNSYESQMILGMLGSVAYSTANTGRFNRYKARLNIESSGNFLDLVASTSGIRNLPFGNKIFGVPYAQYARIDLDFSGSHFLNEKKNTAIVYRLYAGGGYAYGNTRSLPFERMFYVGGSNSMRGWQIRTLGPGAYPFSKNIYPNQVGNIRLEANLEGRFPIWGPLNGALFFDVGNIWSNGIGVNDSVSSFKFNSFYKQLAFNTGLGARLDFGFFVIRADWGIPLFNPGLPFGERWTSKFELTDTVLHFGIGYPF